MTQTCGCLQTDFSAEYADFSIDPDKARRTAVLLRQVESDPQPESGARGAAPRAVNRHPDYYSISLAKDWLFQPGRSQLSFSHLMDVAPEQAKLLKDDLRALMMCRLASPWIGATSLAMGQFVPVDCLMSTILKLFRNSCGFTTRERAKWWRRSQKSRSARTRTNS